MVGNSVVEGLTVVLHKCRTVFFFGQNFFGKGKRIIEGNGKKRGKRRGVRKIGFCALFSFFFFVCFLFVTNKGGEMKMLCKRGGFFLFFFVFEKSFYFVLCLKNAAHFERQKSTI